LSPQPKRLSSIPADLAGGIAFYFLHGDEKNPANQAFYEVLIFRNKHVTFYLVSGRELETAAWSLDRKRCS
jgi:hypothetical protein